MQSFCIGGPQTGDLDYCLRVTRFFKIDINKKAKKDFEFHFDSGQYLIDNVVKAQANQIDFLKNFKPL